MGIQTDNDSVRHPEDVAEFEALSRMAAKFREIMENLVDEVAYFTGEEGDPDVGMSDTVAWDVVHNGDDLATVLRRCKLTLAPHD
jgi:hypothetical protein